jgi:flagellin-specific chaperone FliS
MYTSQQKSGYRNSNPYLAQKILSASPEQLVTYVFDVAIAACINKNKVRAVEAIQLLINSLKFDQKKIATTFYNIYSRILKLIYVNQFDLAENLIREIRDSWNQAMRIN